MPYDPYYSTKLIQGGLGSLGEAADAGAKAYLDERQATAPLPDHVQQLLREVMAGRMGMKEAVVRGKLAMEGPGALAARAPPSLGDALPPEVAAHQAVTNLTDPGLDLPSSEPMAVAQRQAEQRPVAEAMGAVRQTMGDLGIQPSRQAQPEAYPEPAERRGPLTPGKADFRPAKPPAQWTRRDMEDALKILNLMPEPRGRSGLTFEERMALSEAEGGRRRELAEFTEGSKTGRARMLETGRAKRGEAEEAGRAFRAEERLDFDYWKAGMMDRLARLRLSLDREAMDDRTYEAIVSEMNALQGGVTNFYIYDVNRENAAKVNEMETRLKDLQKDADNARKKRLNKPRAEAATPGRAVNEAKVVGGPGVTPKPKKTGK